MDWWSAVFTTVGVIFPLMYRTARGAFESFDESLAQSAQVLGTGKARIFWGTRVPFCKQGLPAVNMMEKRRMIKKRRIKCEENQC